MGWFGTGTAKVRNFVTRQSERLKRLSFAQLALRAASIGDQFPVVEKSGRS